MVCYVLVVTSIDGHMQSEDFDCQQGSHFFVKDRAGLKAVCIRGLINHAGRACLGGHGDLAEMMIQRGANIRYAREQSSP